MAYLDENGEPQEAAKQYLDDNGNPVAAPPAAPSPAQALQGAVAYGVQQDPVAHAKLLQLQQKLGIPPSLSQGNEKPLQQAAELNSLNPQALTALAPATAAWATHPDNAAVAGVDEIHRNAGIEQNAAMMRAYTPSMWETFKSKAADAFHAATGQTVDQVKQNLYQYPLTRAAIDVAGGAAGMVGNVGSFFGLHGSGPTKQNILQRVETNLSPEANTDPASAFHQSNEFDWVAKNIAPMIPAMLATGGTSLLASTMGVSETAAKVLAGLTVGGAFTADQAGKTFTAVSASGGSDYAARLAANRVAAINAVPNALFGATEITPFLRDNPLATSFGIGGLTGASGQASQNIVTGRPALEGVPAAALQGAAMQGGMHLGTEAFLGNLSQAVDAAAESKLRERSPEKFQEAMQQVFQGDDSLRIPADQFQAYFKGKGVSPQDVAGSMGVTNYAEAVLSGGDVEVPKDAYLGKMDSEDQKALLPHVVDPSTGLTMTQHQEGRDELQQWVSGGGPDKMVADAAAADAETAATPEFQAVKEQLRQRYVDAGEAPEVAETLAEKDANVYNNIAKNAGLKPSELVAMYNPKVRAAEAPESPVLYQSTNLPNEGKETSLLTPSGKMPARYVLAEAADLIPSHDPSTFAKDPRYPEGVQERAYDKSKEAQARVIDQAQNYEPAYTVNTNPDAVNGPPVITRDGTVLGGNSRTMSTIRLYRDGKGETYRSALKRQAEEFGISPDAVDGMKEPILVRRIDTPGDTENLRRIGTDLNRSMTGALGAAEKAVSAGKNIRPDTLRNVSGMLQEGDHTLRELMAAQGPKLVQMMVSDGVITDRERPQYVDAATGGLNDAGKAFVEKALLGSVIDDPRLMEDAPKSVLNKIERSLGAITSFSGRADEWNILPVIREAVGELGSIQREGSSVELRTAQSSMFGGERNPLVDAMLKALDGKPNALKDAFDTYSRDADANLPGQSRMFGEANAFDAFNHAFGSSLSEQEFHDGLTRSASAEPARSDNTASDGGIPEPSPASESTGSSERSQPDTSGVRGWFRVLPDGSYEIGKTDIGDLSTFVHEPAHAYLKIIGDLAQREGASDQLKDDYQKTLDFLGARPGEPLTREQQEIWARANEQYLREGKAPSPRLRGVFQRFAVWLGSVYKKASDLGVALNEDIRGVFDRLYAAESGVDKAEAEVGPSLFSTPEDAGWTEEQFKSYAEQNDVSVEQAKSHILGLLNEAAIRDKSQAWREEESNVREAVTAEIDQKPEYTAIRALRKGAMDDGTELTMSKDALVKQFGEQRVKDLQRQHPGMYRTEGTGDPETTAEILGFNSAEEMLQALEASPRRSAAIEKATRDYMTAKHGDIRYDGSLQDQARLAIENDKRADGLHRELSALKKKLAAAKAEVEGRTAELRDINVAPIAAYREAASQMIESKAPADLQPTRYLDASRKYSREAFDALRKGDAQEAANAKHKELLNHFLFREAAKAKEYVGKFESYAKRMSTKGVQEKLGKAGIDYRDQFNRILGRYGLGDPVQTARTLSDWTLEQFNQGYEPAIDQMILNEARSVNYKNAPLAEIRMVHDALVNVRKLASNQLGMEVNGRKIEFDAAINGMIDRARQSIKANPRPVFDENRTAGMIASDYVNRGTALLTRTEFLMNRLDGGAEGPWHDTLWHLASDAQGQESKLQTEVTKRVGDALENIPKEQRLRMLDKVSIEGIGEPITRRQMIDMALNLGNDGNLDRLQKTFMAHGWDVGAIDKVKAALTPEEWKYIQGAWDSLKPLGAAQGELERRMTGLPPLMVKPTPLHLDFADGTSLDLDGGYYPIVMDPRFSKQGAVGDASSTAQNLMESGYGRATTSRGNMKERTGFGGPLLLDHEQILTQHTAKVIKDITHREFMLAAQKIFLDQGIRQTLTETLGLGNEAQMMPWLRTIINDRNGSTVQGLGDLSRAMNGLRTNVVKAALGFKFSTVLLQLTHASSVFLHTSPANYAQAMIDFVAHPHDMTEQIKTLSPNEMATRGDNIDRDMRKILQDSIRKKNLGDMWVKAGMAPVQFMDHMLSFPLWLSVYREAQAANVHLGEAEANYQAMQKADGAVRMGLGSNAPKDLPPIMRQNDFTKLLTTMGGFHNLKYNQIQGAASSFRDGGGVGKLTYGAIMAAIIPAIMGPLITGRGPKEDENVAGWAAKRALLFPAETMAILNIGVEALENGGDVRFTPIVGTIERAAKAGVHATADKEDKDWAGIGMDELQSSMEAFGVSGTDQAFKIGRYAKKVNEGKIDNPSIVDAIAGSGSTKKR
jgi:hypothetical protein